MQIAKWGNSLAVRLPVRLVQQLGLKEGDRVEVVAGDGKLKVHRHKRADEILQDLRRFRGKLPAFDQLNCDDKDEQ